jgi:hypothetical protein
LSGFTPNSTGKGEAISTLDRRDLVGLLSKRFRDIPLAAVPGVERGEALYDSRGLGSMRRRRKMHRRLLRRR